jgi:hypothetical protein
MIRFRSAASAHGSHLSGVLGPERGGMGWA